MNFKFFIKLLFPVHFKYLSGYLYEGIPKIIYITE